MEKKFRITVNGRQYEVTVEDLSEGGSSLIFPEPGDMNVAAPRPSAPRPAPAAPAPAPAEPTGGEAGPGDEVSPLAGVVVSVDVSVGQAVNEGDKLITLEAMKMKTVVVAHKAGKVTKIAVKAGDAVDAGQVLVTIG